MTDVHIDRVACTMDAPATITWATLRREAREAGLSLDHIVDVFEDESLAQLLERRDVLPPLWPTHTARAACIALTARPHGQNTTYRTVKAPRTASGPDLRALFFEAGRAHGNVERVVFVANRAQPCAWRALEGPRQWRNAQRLLNQFNNVVTLHGSRAGLFARIRVATRVGQLALDAFDAMDGVTEVADPGRRFIAPAVVAVVPWDVAIASAGRKQNAYPLCAGPTHVALAVDCAEADDEEKAVRWARRLADRPAARCVTVGIPHVPSQPIQLGEVRS